MIHIYRIGHLPYTPFNENFSPQDLIYLKSKGINVTNSKKEASIFVAGNERALKRFIIKNPFLKNYLLWSLEPRFSKQSKDIYYPFYIFPKVQVMNVYTGNVFTHNISFQQKRFLSSKELNYLTKKPNPTVKPIVALMSYYRGGEFSNLKIRRQNIDLIKKRSELAIYLASQNLIDIYGQGWPPGVSLEDSRFNNRQARKKEILQDYAFNLCFENTVYPRYITEKIWESIEGSCLPIYYGGKDSTIYELFPKNSFIDYSEFETPYELKKFLNHLSNEEFVSRMNKCIDVYNNLSRKPKAYWEKIRIQRLDNIVKKCYEITQNKIYTK